MRRQPGLAAAAAVLSLTVAVLPRPVAAGADGNRDLAQASLTGGNSLEYARELTAIGPRLTGTASYQRAAHWSLAQFRAFGLAHAALHPFAIDRGWERVSARARLVAPAGRALHVAALGWTPSTPEGGVEADVVALESFSPAIVAASRSLDGRIALLPDGEPPGDPDTAARARRGLAVALRAAGVLALISADTDAANDITARGFGVGTAIAVLPVAQIGHDDGQNIRRLLANGAVRMSLELTNRITEGAAADNVIAELAGRGREGEWVLVGAHLDAWDFGAGAQDNATGAAMVLEAARAIAAFRSPPRRSIRFALWGGEEQGQIGSSAYVRAHASDLDHLVAYINTDAGTGRTIGWTAPGRQDVIRGVRPLTQGALDELGAATFDDSVRYAFQSDGAPFILAGIPTLDLNADDASYEQIHHKAADTMDRVDARNLAAAAAAVAATAYAIADAPGRIAERRRPRTKRMD